MNLFPEIRDHLINIFERYRHVLDAELQQRACEYYTIAKMEDDNALLEVVCEEMPPFPERQSALLNRLHSKGNATNDKRTWVIGGKGDNKEREAARFRTFTDSNSTPPSVVTRTQPDIRATTQEETIVDEPVGVYDMMGADPSVATDDVMSSLAGLDLGGLQTAQEVPLMQQNSTAEEEPVSALAGQSHVSTSLALAQMALTKGANVEKVRKIQPVCSSSHADEIFAHLLQWLERLSYNSEGVLYEDEQLQIGVKAEYHGHHGRIALFLGNKVAQPFTSFSAEIECPEPEALSARFFTSPAKEVPGLEQVQYLIQLECMAMFSSMPLVRISFIAGTVRNLVLRLPVFLTRFVEPAHLDANAFFERWKVIGGELYWISFQVATLTIDCPSQDRLERHSSSFQFS